jgi:hypothetical protein
MDEAAMEELRGSKNSALQKRARELGVADEAMDDAADASDPREVRPRHNESTVSVCISVCLWLSRARSLSLSVCRLNSFGTLAGAAGPHRRGREGEGA